jgi:flagellar FliL protein
MAKAKEADEAEKPEGEAAAAEGEPKKGLINKLFGTKKMMMITGGGLLAVLLVIGGGLYFFVFSGHGAKADTKMASASGTSQTPIVPPQVSFFDMPDIVVNIQTADGTPAYLKLSVSLELQAADEKAGVQTLMPRVVDQFQSYLRELRVDDLRGSAGVMRVKEELLRRVNVAAAPYGVRDVLLKEMIIQ